MKRVGGPTPRPTAPAAPRAGRRPAAAHASSISDGDADARAITQISLNGGDVVADVGSAGGVDVDGGAGLAQQHRLGADDVGDVGLHVPHRQRRRQLPLLRRERPPAGRRWLWNCSSRAATPAAWSIVGHAAAVVPSHQPAGPGAGRHAVVEGDLARLHRPPVAGGVLHQAAAAGGQVVGDAGRRAAQRRQLDDVDVGQVPGRQQPPVEPAHVLGRAPGDLVDDRLDAAAPRRPAGRGPTPSGTTWSTTRRRSAPQWAPASDRPEERQGRGDHLVDVAEVAVGEVEQRQVEQLLAVACSRRVVDERRRLDAGAGPRRPATWTSRAGSRPGRSSRRRSRSRW